jgi:hypothetical protein
VFQPDVDRMSGDSANALTSDVAFEGAVLLALGPYDVLVALRLAGGGLLPT